MALDPLVLQFGGSLLAVLALAGLARALKLGASKPIASPDEARRAAEALSAGFAACTVAIGADGTAALVRDGAGRIMLLRMHGAHRAGRILGPRARARVDADALLVDSGEPRFGTARLPGIDAAFWCAAIDAIGSGDA